MSGVPVSDPLGPGPRSRSWAAAGGFLVLAALLAFAQPRSAGASSDWRAVAHEPSTEDSSGMTVKVKWKIEARPSLFPSDLVFLPAQGIRLKLEAWSVEPAAGPGRVHRGDTASATCSAADRLLDHLQEFLRDVEVEDPQGPGAVTRMIQQATEAAIRLLMGDTNQPGLRQRIEEAIAEMAPGCEHTFEPEMEVLHSPPKKYRVDLEGSARVIEMISVSLAGNGRINAGLAGGGVSGNLSLSADRFEKKELRRAASVRLTCPPGTIWNEEEVECVSHQDPDPSGWECPEDAEPGSGEYCACIEHVFEEVCFDCEFSDGSHFPADPDDPPVDEESTLVCRSNYPWFYEDGLTCAIIELFCLGGPFPRPKALPPGTTGEALAGCSDGLSWGPCPDQPEGLPLLIPAQSPSYGFPPCWKVGEVIVHPVPGVCENATAGLLADLTVASVEKIGGPSEAGEELHFVVRVRNQGASVASSAGLLLVLQTPGGTHDLELHSGGLNPGEERSLEISASQFPYVALSGPHLLDVRVDPYGVVNELTEGNNSRSLSFAVGTGSIPASDLLVTPLELVPDHPSVSQPVSVAFEIRNAGIVGLPEAAYEVRTDHDGEVSVQAFPLPATQPGDSLQRIFTLSEVGEGAYGVSVFVDSEEALTEDNEENNTTLRTFMVESAAGECLPCTSGQPNNAVGASYCTAPADPLLPPWQGHLYTCLGVRANGTSCESSGIHPNGWSYTGPRCPDPATLYEGAYHRDLCGNPGVCPGTMPLPF